MIAGTEEGLLVHHVMGLGQSNIVNGDFSVNVSLGYKIENGEIVGRVKDVMLAGNVYDALHQIEAIGSEPEWFMATHAPPIKLASLSVVAKTWRDGFYTEIAAGDHALVADEPANFGGTNRGPSPYELLSASLAACTTMTLKMYAGFKEIDLDAVTVKVSHKKMHAEACADCRSEDGKIDEFRREVTLAGNLDEAQRQRLLEMADRCPVHQSLHGEIKVRTTLR